MSICLPKEISSKFLDAIKSGDLDVEKLSTENTADRRTAFDKVLGKEYGEAANTLFENKLLLKDQQRGLIEFIKTLGGLKPEERTDFLSKIGKLDRLLNPKEEEAFLADATKQHLGLTVSESETKTISELAKKIDQASPANRDTIKNVGDLVTAADKLDLTPEQKTDVESLKSQLKDIQAEKDKIASERQAEKDKMQQQRQETREKIKAENKAKRDALRAKQQIERETARDEARDKKFSDYLEKQTARDLERKQYKEQQATERINKRIEDNEAREAAKELKDYDKETKRIQKNAEKKLNKQTVGKLGKALKDHFGDVLPKDVDEKIQNLKSLFTTGENHNFSGVSDEYLKAKGEFQGYVSKLNPDSKGVAIAKNLIQIARNNLITNIATPLKTYVSGITNHTMGLIVRRLGSLSLHGDHPELAEQITNETFKTFIKTGVNTAAMESLDDNSSILGSHSNKKGFTGIKENESFDAPKESPTGKGTGTLQKVTERAAAISHKIAITLEHNIPFTQIYSKVFGDALNFHASAFARIDGLKGTDAVERSKELMLDAARIEPETDAGKLLRQTAQQSAARVLNVNDTWASRFSVGTKNVLNKISPGIPIGDLIEPIAKIPANIIANGLENTLVGAPEAAIDIVKGKMKLNSDDLQTRYQGLVQYRSGIEHAIRIAGAVGIAAVITSGLSKNDFRTDAYGNHFVKIGKYWVNTEYFASISPNIAGFMAMKQFPHENPAIAYLTGSKVGEGALGSVLNIPGVNEVYKSIQSIAGGNAIKDSESQLESRAVPAIVANMFKDRPINRIFFGADGVESTSEYNAENKSNAAKSAATRKANAAAKAKLK